MKQYHHLRPRSLQLVVGQKKDFILIANFCSMSIVPAYLLYVMVSGFSKYLVQPVYANFFTLSNWVFDDNTLQYINFSKIIQNIQLTTKLA